MDNKEGEYLRKMAAHAEETIRLLSNSRKPERERGACAAFLRCCGVRFSINEIISVDNDPPDVLFRSAQFEVVEILDKGRRRHDEWKTRANLFKEAKAMDDASMPRKDPVPCSYAEVFNLLIEQLRKKSSHYGGARGCAELDALVYVDLQHKYLDIRSSIPDDTKLRGQSWRSVSFVMSPYSHVVYAAELAPRFLREVAGQTMQKWEKPDGLFDL